MSRIIIFLLLILTAVLPVIILWLWLKKKKYSLPFFWFLTSLSAGIVSIVAAALIQNFFPGAGPSYRLSFLFFNVFIRIALVEEGSRLLTLFPLIKAGSFKRDFGISAAMGLAAGLGFAAAENAFYGMSNISVTLLRFFTAAPLHGACGIRSAAAVFLFPKQPVKAIFYFFSAVVIHGTYNLIIQSPAIPSILVFPTAIAALFISLPMINDNLDDKA